MCRVRAAATETSLPATKQDCETFGEQLRWSKSDNFEASSRRSGSEPAVKFVLQLAGGIPFQVSWRHFGFGILESFKTSKAS
jgi:hypothetical protein